MAECPTCGEEFTPNNHRHVYCKPECRPSWPKKKEGEKKCRWCGELFTPKNHFNEWYCCYEHLRDATRERSRLFEHEFRKKYTITDGFGRKVKLYRYKSLGSKGTELKEKAHEDVEKEQDAVEKEFYRIFRRPYGKLRNIDNTL